MAVSESGNIIARLVEQGYSMETIGQAVGRNRSLIRQVKIGAKPGNNLRDALGAVEARLAALTGDTRSRSAAVRAEVEARQAPVAAAPRREQRVRRATTVRAPDGSWSSAQIKRQASRSTPDHKGGAGLLPGMRQAAANGERLAFDVTFARGVTVQGTSGGSKSALDRQSTGPGGTVELAVPNAAQAVQAIEVQHNGDVTAWLAAELIGRGQLGGVADERDAAGRVEGVAMRSWRPR